ncbi:hypothetical protein H6G36_25670 [Anabaena minutissima FACHB-250]|nr:hypothetical protein [Anabaena minutissima FACHB-250]
MAFIYDSLVVEDIAALKALTSSTTPKRVDKLFLAVGDNGEGDRAWYQYDASASNTEDLPSIVNPTDTTGRWFQFGGNGGSGVSFGGLITCTDDCTIGGKAFTFYAPQMGLKLEIVPGFDITITSGSTSIQIHRWSELPNTELTGREFAAELPHTGGTVEIDIDSTYRWISIFAKNPDNGDLFDGVCFVVDGNTCTLMGFS